MSKIFKRTLIIFLLGYLMYWFPFAELHNGIWEIRPISETRVMGVLQRIALCYLFTSLIVYFVKSNTAIIVISIFLLVIYQVLLLSFGDSESPYGMLTNAGTYLDKFVLGDAHLYHGEGVAFDPQGIMSTLPSLSTLFADTPPGNSYRRKIKVTKPYHVCC